MMFRRMHCTKCGSYIKARWYRGEHVNVIDDFIKWMAEGSEPDEVPEPFTHLKPVLECDCKGFPVLAYDDIKHMLSMGMDVNDINPLVSNNKELLEWVENELKSNTDSR